ncbi:hypothetical protein EJ05DRAFT_511854 [Pseudovirgaria hyperparasitica]|uniref:Autophagy-related protein 27 n=1 Tax=Pseudovirgaria hyperparasitica TaxID=470096 RepID=A0A6A6W2G2_9PEZI|nr:uncharacterized protein EJ05DRAFT_511854 [Pseudovirgaria hyperparasitica]KAF2757118.1 hypothetical protein EJ05DRAFT_511854 [Pseudovirgaria hyperparasitica]
MRFTREDYLPLSALLFLPTLVSAASSIDCPNIRINDVPYDLSALKGAHTVFREQKIPGESIHNQTFTLDLCSPLIKEKSDDDLSQCKQGANICGVKYLINPSGAIVDEVVSVAGQFASSYGGHQDAKWTRLKDSDSHEDSKKDGLRLEMNGGRHPMEGSGGTPQRALIEFICDPDVDGLDGLGETDPHFKSPKAKNRRDDDGGDDDNNDNENNGGDNDGDDDSDDGDQQDDSRPLKYKSYERELPGGKKMDVLRLEWHTKYACENAERDVPKKSNGSWGFFTWFIVVLFLSVAAYLVFGSWLNYSRYGARGWDLLPHGDTIRDLPYLLKDWARRATGSLSSSRGGYSAV